MTEAKQTSTMREVVNLLPGPVVIHPSVQEAFAAPPVSHRAAEFVRHLQELRTRLGRLSGAAHTEILLGSGTLGNDAVAAQLSLQPGPGLVLVNGEFGERLVKHARRFGLTFHTLEAPWGAPFDYAEVDRALAERPDLRWLWAVHCETSTGVLNDLDALRRLARSHKLDLCLDCISSLGTVPVDLTGVYLATGVSGKGLASFPGLALVFHHHEIAASESLPRYLDVGYYAACDSLPFTTSSNLVFALSRSLELLEDGGDGGRRAHRERLRLATWLREELGAAGWPILAPPEIASPAVFTLVPDGHRSALELGEILEGEGILLSYRSGYLVRRNLLQICLMGEHRRDELAAVVERLAALRSA